MNPFEKNFVDIKDDPEGQRVLLECPRCGEYSTQAKYWPDLKVLSWKCTCEYIQKVNIDLSE